MVSTEISHSDIVKPSELSESSTNVNKVPIMEDIPDEIRAKGDHARRHELNFEKKKLGSPIQDLRRDVLLRPLNPKELEGLYNAGVHLTESVIQLQEKFQQLQVDHQHELDLARESIADRLEKYTGKRRVEDLDSTEAIQLAKVVKSSSIVKFYRDNGHPEKAENWLRSLNWLGTLEEFDVLVQNTSFDTPASVDFSENNPAMNSYYKGVKSDYISESSEYEVAQRHAVDQEKSKIIAMNAEEAREFLTQHFDAQYDVYKDLIDRSYSQIQGRAARVFVHMLPRDSHSRSLESGYAYKSEKDAYRVRKEPIVPQADDMDLPTSVSIPQHELDKVQPLDVHSKPRNAQPSRTPSAYGIGDDSLGRKSRELAAFDLQSTSVQEAVTQAVQLMDQARQELMQAPKSWKSPQYNGSKLPPAHYFGRSAETAAGVR